MRVSQFVHGLDRDRRVYIRVTHLVEGSESLCGLIPSLFCGIVLISDVDIWLILLLKVFVVWTPEW